MKKPKRTTEADYERLLAQERLILDATETVVELLESQGVSRQELARRIGKSKSFVSQLLSGERNMTLRTLADLGYALEHAFSLALSTETDAGYTTGEARNLLSPQTVEECLRAAEQVEIDTHEYALAV